MITSLKEHQVFVFGSNGQGFHGAGSAGLACRGDSRNNWRQDPWFLRAMKSPVGSPDRVGKWATFGVARGYQVGREGLSYAIQTVTRPGARRSITLGEIAIQVGELFAFALEHPDLGFLLTPVGTGYAGYSQAEVLHAIDHLGCPRNVVPVGWNTSGNNLT